MAYLTVIDASRPLARVGVRPVNLLDVADGPAVGAARRPRLRAAHVVAGGAEPAAGLGARHQVAEVAVGHHGGREPHEAPAGEDAGRVDELSE